VNAEQAFQENRTKEHENSGKAQQQENKEPPLIVPLDMYAKRTAAMRNRNPTH
jgi:hypothetical protein